MKMSYVAMTLTVLLVSCSPASYDTNYDTVYQPAPPPPAPEEAAQKAEQEAMNVEARRVATVRAADPALDWVSVGISTGKFSESIDGMTFDTQDECVRWIVKSDHICFPIPALPQSYWDAERPVEVPQ